MNRRLRDDKIHQVGFILRGIGQSHIALCIVLLLVLSAQPRSPPPFTLRVAGAALSTEIRGSRRFLVSSDHATPVSIFAVSQRARKLASFSRFSVDAYGNKEDNQYDGKKKNIRFFSYKFHELANGRCDAQEGDVGSEKLHDHIGNGGGERNTLTREVSDIRSGPCKHLFLRQVMLQQVSHEIVNDRRRNRTRVVEKHSEPAERLLKFPHGQLLPLRVEFLFIFGISGT